MNGFTILKEISNAFKEDLRLLSSELSTAKVQDSFEDGVVKKIRVKTLLTSKLRLLKAKPLSCTPQIKDGDKTTIIMDYEDTAITSLIKNYVIKSTAQACAVKSILTVSERSLTPEMLTRKRNIKEQLLKYYDLDAKLRQLHVLMEKKQDQYEMVRDEWDAEVGLLRDLKSSSDDAQEFTTDELKYQKLHKLVDKIKLMQWMMSKFVTARTDSYDWLKDPYNRLNALKLARDTITMETFLLDD